MCTSRLDSRFCFRLLVVTLFVAGPGLWHFSDIVLAEQTQQALSPAEKWVLEQVAASVVANLKERFPNEKDRVLSAAFVEKLLTGELEDALVHRRGVRIKHAVFTEPLDLVNAEVRYETRLENCRFEDEVNLLMSHFHRIVSFSRSRFKKAYFGGMKVESHVFFNEAVFTESVDFRHAQIGGGFVANGAQFTNPEKEAYFGGMKVESHVFFKEAVFMGSVDFSHAQIGGGFEANGAQFNNAKKAANFTNMKVGGTAFLATGKKAVFKGPVDLRGAQFLNLRIQATSWPTKSVSVELDGMTYKHINAGTEEDAWKNLLAWVDDSAYSAQPYVQLEAFFRAQGHSERADAVFVAWKRRQRKEALGGPLSPAWWSNVFLEVLVRHGRTPERAFYWSVLVVLFGFLLFRRREDMEPQKREDPSRPYNLFWYSLDLFLPFIDLQAAKVWMPRQDRRFARHYARVHTILGWILIPIGVAAVMGIIK